MKKTSHAGPRNPFSRLFFVCTCPQLSQHAAETFSFTHAVVSGPMAGATFHTNPADGRARIDCLSRRLLQSSLPRPPARTTALGPYLTSAPSLAPSILRGCFLWPRPWFHLSCLTHLTVRAQKANQERQPGFQATRGLHQRLPHRRLFVTVSGFCTIP